jgi:ABC-type lipoprotein release transport system permease subunit
MHLAVALAAATATATLTGALLVGDSVRATLEYAFETRLGNVTWVISAQERFFGEGLSQRLKKNDIHTAPVLQLRGMVTRGDGAIRVNQLRILGVDDRFFNMSLTGDSPARLEEGTALVNSALAARLRIEEDNVTELVLRIDNPAAISRNLVLAPFKDSTISMRLPVTGVADDTHFGRFSLEANQQESLNLFVPITWLQKQIKRDGKANLLLISNPSELPLDFLTETLNREWRLEDAESTVEALGKDTLELKSSRVFIDHSLTGAALQSQPNALRLLTYFVNELRVGDTFTPYSMVTAVNREGDFAHLMPPDMKDDQIVINQWLADDLNAGVGDLLTLKYFVPSGRQSLKDAQKSFRICRIIPLEGAAADSTLMPDLPGLSDSENCSDWDPSLPIDLDRIRDKDETYWDDYRGTPKAFVTLAAGQAMWANSYGDLTAIRFKADPSERDNLAEGILRFTDPASVGLSVIPVRETGIRAMGGGMDFGQLFLALSMFLIVSGILLIWLLFVFSVEGRKDQTGMLLAIGFPAKRIRNLYLFEGLFIALIGALVGAIISLAYTRLLTLGISTAWQGAVAGMAVRYSASIQSLIIGFLAGFLIAFIAMTWTLHRQMKSSAHSLLSGSESSDGIRIRTKKRRWTGWGLSLVSFAGAVLLIIMSKSFGSGAMAGVFFGAGSLLLVSMMIWAGMMLGRMGATSHSSFHSLMSLALRNSARRRGRSMAVVVMLACGVFMVVAINAFRIDPGKEAELRASGTGGFTLYAESSVPIVQDLGSVSSRSFWGMNPSTLEGTRFVNLRVRDGDDASCLNLNRAQEPRILGVSPNELAERGAFSFQDLEEKEYQDRPWDLLKQGHGDGVIPAIGDYSTVFWGLGRKIGDILIYHNRKGEEIQVRLVGIIRDSIMQGNLLISEEAMARYFPEVEGYRAWLIDTPVERRTEVSEHLTRRMADAGLSVESAVERLEVFSRVQNTYLSIFLVLGGLGLLLGCIGLGLIVARNLLERQGELAMLRAVGFSKRALLQMVCYEHVYLLAAGLLTGLICAIISVTPAIRAATGQLPLGLLTIMTLMIGISGVFWVVISTGISLRGAILTPLRNE